VSVHGIDHAGITVASVEAALGFYRDLLGLRVIDEGAEEGHELDAIVGLTGVRMLYAELDLGGGQVLEITQYLTPPGAQLAQRPCDPGASHLALRVDDVDALCERLAAAGVTIAGRPTTITEPGAWHRARCVYIDDPDGRTVELIQRPR
jgi:lactoylglutathione lyase